MSVLGIDASNIQGGGGITHLVELIKHAEPKKHGFEKVVIWGAGCLDRLPDRDWLKKCRLKTGMMTTLEQLVWMKFRLKRQFFAEGCSVLFSPGGTFSSNNIPYVSMSQNMLLFEREERQRFPFGWTRLRYAILRRAQIRSFSSSAGLIFISNYARSTICKQLPFAQDKRSRVIYHGIDERFKLQDRQRETTRASVRVLYVSRVNYYKHQWNVVKAIDRLNGEGINCRLRLVGGGSGKAMEKLLPYLDASEHVDFVGEVDYDSIETEYHRAHVFLFASTCENMPNIVVEAMASGLAIASSNYGPMPEVLQDGAVYFDPLSVDSIVESLREVLVDHDKRALLSRRSRMISERFSWSVTADETFEFLANCSSQ